MKHLKLRHATLTIVLPVYRNADTLAELAQRLHAALDPIVPDHLILMVNDQSPDESWSVIGKLCETDGRIAAVTLTQQAGQQHALLAGMTLADCDWLAVMDADLQDTPEVLRALYDKALDTGCTLYAERHGQYETWNRMLSSFLFKSFISLLCGLPRRCGTFFVAPRQVTDKILGFLVPCPHVPLMARYASTRIATVPFVRPERACGSSAYNFKGRIKAALNVLHCAWALRHPPHQHTPTVYAFSAVFGQGWSV